MIVHPIGRDLGGGRFLGSKLRHAFEQAGQTAALVSLTKPNGALVPVEDAALFRIMAALHPVFVMGPLKTRPPRWERLVQTATDLGCQGVLSPPPSAPDGFLSVWTWAGAATYSGRLAVDTASLGRAYPDRIPEAWWERSPLAAVLMNNTPHQTALLSGTIPWGWYAPFLDRLPTHIPLLVSRPNLVQSATDCALLVAYTHGLTATVTHLLTTHTREETA